MRVMQHQSNNDVSGAPDGWDQNPLPCNVAPITRTRVNGMPAVVTFWKPSPEELEALNNNGFIAVFAIGETMPPMAVEVSP